MANKIQTNSIPNLIEPERSSSGFVLADPDDSLSWRILLPDRNTSLTWDMALAGVACLLVEGAIAFGWLQREEWRVAVIAIASLVWGIHRLAPFVRLKPGEVILLAYPLRMGETCRVRYRRRLRWGSVPKPGQVTAKWLCYEWVLYSLGTESETETHLLWETDLPARSVSPQTVQVEYVAEIEVRAEGPPSFDAKNNQVRWELQVTVDLPGVAKDTSYFRFKVLPEFARRSRST